MTTTTTLDVTALARAIESRDAAAQLAVYAPDAELVIVDALNPPSNPRVLQGSAAIGEFIADTCARDMTHHVERIVADATRIAFEVHCRYPDGVQVLCLCIADVEGGRIVGQQQLQAWDS